MGWFTQLCRNLGLMVHNARHPDSDESQRRKVKRRSKEEERRQDGVIVRRTTIEEIEFPPGDDPADHKKP